MNDAVDEQTNNPTCEKYNKVCTFLYIFLHLFRYLNNLMTDSINVFV